MRVEVKICGLTNVEDVGAALDCGVDYLGFVFYRGSPRCITLEKFLRIADRLGCERKAVVVFVNSSRKDVEEVIGIPCVRAIQLHGEEAPSEFQELGVPIWRVVRWQDGEWKPHPDLWSAERYVVDASIPNCYGGTGVRADWTVAGALAKRRPVMLAGGLTPENVKEAIRIVKPLGVDVSSGVEIAPGKKDLAKLRSFVSNARAAAAAMADA
ncbi:MAG: phosphoribosylanthranilate isomerase [Kiritimatiellae bacterium]|nr:phosphoribosylanthranilate isomerase [Kiritimatiellia bacterium]